MGRWVPAKFRGAGSKVFEGAGALSLATWNARALTHYTSKTMNYKPSEVDELMSVSSVVAPQETHWSRPGAMAVMRRWAHSRR
eukprot:2964456-Pyramimonas_sp.AAC.2